MQKLYVVVRRDLSNSQRAVQAGHALAEYLLRGPKTTWSNGTLVYLGVKNEQELLDICNKLSYLCIDWIGFKEPDRNNELTAICVGEQQGLFNTLRLL